ncbi:MAG: glycosyltransferase family 4 protein [Pseudomonadales bacterium]
MTRMTPVELNSQTAKPAPLRICLMGYRSAPFGGGQGIYIRYLSKALMEAGHSVDVLSGQPYPHLVDGVSLIKAPGLNLFENGLLSLRLRHLSSWANIVEWCSKLTGGFAEPYAFGRRAAAYLEEHGHKYDVIHDNQSLGYGLLDIQKKGMPLVVTIHHPIKHDVDLALKAARNWWQRVLIRRWHSFLFMQTRVVRKLKFVTTVSECSRQDIASAFEISVDRIRLIHNGIDTDVFAPQPQIERQQQMIVATASADQPLKGLHFLLRAFANLREHYPQLSLTVVGKPKPGGATERLIARLQLGDALQFVHGISTEELVGLYACATLAVVPSLYEGFGLPAGEAMACATPLVSADGGALPEITGDAAIVVPAGNEHALQQAIAELLENAALREDLSIRGRQRIEQLFSWKVAALEMTAFYREAIEDAKSGVMNELGQELSAHANS